MYEVTEENGDKLINPILMSCNYKNVCSKLGLTMPQYFENCNKNKPQYKVSSTMRPRKEGGLGKRDKFEHPYKTYW